MIQRIQTVFWLVVAVLFVVMIPQEWMTLVFPDGNYSVSPTGIVHDSTNIGSTIPLLFYTIIMAVFNFVIIFLYKKRILQWRLTFIDMILTLGAYGIILLYRYYVWETEPVATNWGYPLIIPGICAVLEFLAWRAVIRDEIKVRSLDRLR